MNRVVLGVDIGGTAIKTRREGRILQARRDATPASLDEFRATLESMIGELTGACPGVYAAGIGCVVDPVTTCIDVLPGTLHYREGQSLAALALPPDLPSRPITTHAWLWRGRCGDGVRVGDVWRELTAALEPRQVQFNARLAFCLGGMSSSRSKTRRLDSRRCRLEGRSTYALRNTRTTPIMLPASLVMAAAVSSTAVSNPCREIKSL
jgi:hypothetical protein